jgi:dGTPase
MKQEKIDGSFVKVAFEDEKAVRRVDNPHDNATMLRSNFIRDIDKIMCCPYYNRYTDKTQVFSLYKNDDVTRRSLHVQLVSRIARTIGKALNLNLELIEAIALGHDIGHTPFGHAGETFLDELYSNHTGRRFSHNIHSVRVLDGIFPYNITLQTLDGIESHDGEFELAEYRPKSLSSFEEFDKLTEACYLDKANVKKRIPSTLEGCVVRISDIIAYLSKDRQDAERLKLVDSGTFSCNSLGDFNAQVVNNLSVNIIENSYGKHYIKMDEEYFVALQLAKRDNYELIYKNKEIHGELENNVRPMFAELYEKLLKDLVSGDKTSPIFRHHINYINKSFYKRQTPYEETEPNQIVVDFIASMTDDYFVDIHAHLFPNSKYKISYKGYTD